MIKKWVPGVLIFQVGLVIVIVSAIADHIGLGGPYIFFGPRQLGGVVVGAVVAFLGLRAALNR